MATPTTPFKYRIKDLINELPRKTKLIEVARAAGITYETLSVYANMKPGDKGRMSAEVCHALSKYLSEKLNRSITMEDLINISETTKSTLV